MLQTLPEGEYWRYLRKSRADLEAEARGEGETLAKHKRALDRLTKASNILVTESFEEVESGESLFYRTEMLRMMDEMEKRRPKGILVMDIDRFGRGNMQEQGLILDAFRRLNILIVTPRKVYDLNDEFDEEYSEFEAFMARKELKIINRRLQGGRIRSVEEGNYVGTRPPYGYRIGQDEKGGRILIPHPEQAEVVLLIFEWYVIGLLEHNGEIVEMGATKIAKKLDELSVPTYRENTKWNFNVILQILRNAVYIGRIQWKKQERKKTKNADKAFDYRKRNESEIIDVQGKHEAIVDETLFQRAQEKLTNNLSNPVKPNTKLANPLSGIVFCDKCGASMIYKNYPRRGFAHIVCNNRYCANKSSRFDLVETRIVAAMDEWLKNYKHAWSVRKKQKESGLPKIMEQSLKALEQELQQLQGQKRTLHDLLERGIYDEETFLERSQDLMTRIKETMVRIEMANKDLSTEAQRKHAQSEIIPNVERVLKQYNKTKDPVLKNRLLKSIVLEVKYRKEKTQTGDEFEIRVTPKLPE